MILGTTLASGLASIPAGGLSALQNDLIQNWIGPAAIIIVAAMSVKHLVGGHLRKMAAYAAAAVLVFVMIYGAPTLFQGENATFTKAGTNIAKNVNVAVAPGWLNMS